MTTPMPPQTEDLPNFRIPPHPKLLSDLNKVSHDEDLFIATLNHDPTISAKVLFAANTPVYEFTEVIASIPHAVSMLGIQGVLNIIRTVYLKLMTPSIPNLFLDALWQNHLLVALVAKKIIDHLPFTLDREEAYTLGLFHNCGIPLILEQREDYQDIMISSYGSITGDISATEEKSLNTPHATIGFLIAQEWQLPSHILSCILEHHNPKAFQPSAKILDEYQINLCSVLKMSEHFCCLYRYIGKQEHDYEWMTIRSQICQNLGITEKMFFQLKDELTQELQNMVRIDESSEE